MTLETYAYVAVGTLIFLMVVPAIVIASWYHSTMAKIAGGRALLEENKKHQPKLARSRLPIQALNNIVTNAKSAMTLNDMIMSGQFGEAAKKLQKRTYIYVGLRISSVFIAFVAVFVIRITQFPT